MEHVEGQGSNNVEREFTEDDSDQACFMVQGNDSLEINSESNLDGCASTSNDKISNEDAHMLNEELFMFCEDLLRKYKLLINKSLDLKKENEFFFKIRLCFI